jgi:hypothetical protein
VNNKNPNGLTDKKDLSVSKNSMNSNKSWFSVDRLCLLGACLWVLGGMAAYWIGDADAPQSSEDVYLGLYFGWNGLLAFLMSWSFDWEHVELFLWSMVLTVVSSLFGMELIRFAGKWSWPISGAWALAVFGGLLLGLRLNDLRKR